MTTHPESTETRARTNSRAFDLQGLRFTAKIDFVTVLTPHKLLLPELTGMAKWPKTGNGRRLTIHDPSPSDIQAILRECGPLRLAELEVCIDVRCAHRFTDNERTNRLNGVMVDLFARQLDPVGGDGIGILRGGYRVGHRGVLPYNKKLPESSDQLLYGHRNDTAQVKAYFKRTDNRRALPTTQWSARVEVALRGMGLAHDHDLCDLSRLPGFPFRSELSKYFRHIGSVRRKELFSPAAIAKASTAVIKSNQALQDTFRNIGIGCVLRGGRFEGIPIKKLPDAAINNRLGQALMRLEREHSAPENVRGRV